MPGRVLSRGSFCVMRRYIKALYIIRLTINPVPWIQTAPYAMAMELILLAAAALGKAPMMDEARGAIMRRG